MEYRYKNSKKWKREGLKSLWQAMAAVAANIITMASIDPSPLLLSFIQIVTGVIIISGVINTFYFFTRSGKEYITVDDQAVLIRNGPFFNKKEVLLGDMTGLVEREEELVIEYGKKRRETLVEKENLSEEDVRDFKQEIRNKAERNSERFRRGGKE
ncbi:hypothetical protein [Salimicrobium salexigens]|uniref:PH domain-containing protein n=1 Tax=Salimicrobium salexigens TaxID=908941 RepID=A0ABY1KKS6_9BACI|nr:hypothetical protein [Salimicrobium salexigens]SIS46472.1 hypothetical protein SAMN05421758_101297 [Salimicrobium salexigens]